METVKNIQANNMNHIEVPVTEPQRQFYYMDLAKQLIKDYYLGGGEDAGV